MTRFFALKKTTFPPRSQNRSSSALKESPRAVASAGSFGYFRSLRARRGKRNKPVAVLELPNNQLRSEKRAFRDDKASAQERREGKTNSQSRDFHDIETRIGGIRNVDSANDEAVPGRVHCALNLDLTAQRSNCRLANALLNAAGLQVEIDTKKDNCGCCEDASRNDKKSLGNCGHAGKLRNFSGM